ncbi:reverse transcriptase domain-containing protein [Tanacetum coccineum]|uniref:Reverse transcriptase domain-containing protein n=1 Tax=Tanacetum coccineum TaxID=301880 RepID=A0ABQ4XNB0_9ASTR
MTFKHLTKEVLVEVLSKRSIEEKETLQVETKKGKSWMTPIHEYLVSGLLPEDPKESRKIRVKVPQYKFIRGSLYRRSFYTSWLRCVASPQTGDIVKEIHEGSRGFNTEPQSMVEQSAIRKIAENSAITAGSVWSFSHWGVNILGPLPTALRGFKFLAIAVEHSTKLVESKHMTTISGRHAERFVWEYVVTQSFSPITEHMEIMNHIEKQLARSQQGWVDNLAQILWVHRTLPRNSQKETPFSLTYGFEAIIPISKNNVAKDDRGRIKEVDKRRESNEVASIKEAYYQNKLRKHHNERSSHSTYKIGDFILLSQTNIGSPQTWQGPHMISEVQEVGLYKIIDASDHSLIQTAKSTSLRKFYM